MNLSFADIIIILIYFFGIIFFGFLKKVFGNTNNSESKAQDYILAGRKVTLPFFVASLVATWYGNILGIGEFVYSKGLLAWFCFGIVYYCSAIAYAFLITSKIRISIAETIPEQIGKKFGDINRLISSLIILLITLPAIYVLMVGIFFQMFFKLELKFTIVLATIFTFSYIYVGGFKTNILTNSFQFFLMYSGFFVFTFFGMNSVNWNFQFVHSLPSEHLHLFGGVSWQYIFSWILISLQTFVDPSFYQRCMTARDVRTAKKGIFISVFFWVIFDLMTLFLGLLAKYHFPNIYPIYAYPMLSDFILPPLWKGFVIVAMLATIISTLESYAFLSGIIIGKEILGRVEFTKKFNELSLVRIGIVISGFLSILLAILIPSAIDIIFKTSSIVVPALFYPLIASLTRKIYLTSKQVFAIMTVSSLFTFLVVIIKEKALTIIPSGINFAFSIEPMVFGFILSSLLVLMFIKFKRIP